MCEHSQSVALEMRFKAMQFNLVVETNEGAARLWRKLGFEIVGTIPKAFDHAELGYVGAYVMFKWLEQNDTGEGSAA
jgi:ribosomal protein S18 acetylase RimI-like enzyme